MKTAVLVLCCISFGSADAALRLGSPFADDMVLQRGKPVPVWGWADPGAEVSVSFAGQVRTVTAGTNGAWRVNLAPLEASSVGRTLTVASHPANSTIPQSNNQTISLSDVLVGEVWFCAGQSNMELPLVGWNPRFRDGKGALVAQWMNDPEIRFVHASNYKWSAVPRAEAAYKVEWKKVTPKSVTSGNSFSAVALYYALELRRALNVPVGLVGTYWGGTMIQPWTPKSGFALAPNCAPEAEYVPKSAEEIAAGAKIPYEKHAQPGVLWNEMVSPWTPLAIRGFVWYQGCSNAAQWKHYADLMHALYRGWAKEFENPDLRLEFVQLAPWGEDVIPRIQQAQAKFAAEEPLANMAVINDIGNIHDIHPNEKQLVGQRLAALALRHDYGWDIKADSSVVKSFEVTDGAFRLKFDDPSGFYLYNPDYNMHTNGFEVAGADGVWHRAEIANNHWHYVGSGKYRKLWSWGVLTGDTVVVRSPEVPEPRKLRYLHSHPWFGSLYNSVNLPVGAFELEAEAPDWAKALDRAAVVFDRPNGPACMRTNILWNGTVETNRFTTGRPEYVMPFGVGDLSAMASFGADALELHLSQASWLTPRPTSPDDPAPQFKSPGHVQVRFADLKTNDFTRFSLKMDMRRGRLLLEAETVRGAIRAEMFGDRASGALVVDVDDARTGVATPCVTVERKLGTLTVIGADKPSAHLTLAIGATGEAARQASSMKLDDLVVARDAWWRDFWRRGWVRLEGDADATLLERSWYVNLYQYANVGYAKMPPKFNGGPGIVYGDMRCWGRDVWWQNTRELIWPMAAAGHADFAKRYLEFYSDCLANLRLDAYLELKPWPGAIVLMETMCLLRSPLFATTNLPPYDVRAPYRLPTDAERAEVTRVRRARAAAHTTHVFSSGTELLQQMIDYVRFTGDRSFLPRIAAWLRAQTEVYLVLLEEEADGRFHIHGTNVNESWFVVDDSTVDLAAARICLSLTMAHGAEFGYPAALVEAARGRLARLADYPVGRPYAEYYNKKTGLVFTGGAEVYHPCRLAKGMRKCNSEMNELYLVHPFAMTDVCRSPEGRERMKGVFPAALALAANQYGGGAGWGWLPIGVAAARFAHPDAATLVADHARRTCRWPYGGGKSPGAKLYRGSAVENTVYMDGSGVVQTGVQELLLQSHADEPSSEFLTGGPVRLLPAGVPKAWKGSFRLQARGGFTVEASFADGRVTQATATSSRGGVFRWVDPSDGTVKTRPTTSGESFALVR